jgi:16S rRNA (cytosine967-C5)-methyltransferase
VAHDRGEGGPLSCNGAFDIVLVDAPCSGSGTWRRSPELKWRLTPQRLRELTALQSRLIDDGARQTKSGGRLVYVTCSLLTCENEDICKAFLERSPGFHVVPAAEAWRDAHLPKVPDGVGDYFRTSPYRTATDGFFACIMAKAVE